jgi:Protein of unknown function (DUF4058)
MPSPFPGMNPYLEHPDRWSTVHNRLIVAIADVLTPQLAPKYQVDIEKRIYEVLSVNSLLVGRSDASIQQPKKTAVITSSPASITSAVAQPVQVSLPVLEEVREAYLEVKDAVTQAVITVIEILSPTNKRGDGRQKYEQKRHQILGSSTHLVEIDHLREGQPLPMSAEAGHSDYRILVSHAEVRPIADLYPFNLPDPIPCFPLPLKGGDTEPIIDLKTLLDDVYQRSGYDYFLDDASPVIPPLSPEQAIWVEQILHST